MSGATERAGGNAGSNGNGAGERERPVDSAGKPFLVSAIDTVDAEPGSAEPIRRGRGRPRKSDDNRGSAGGSSAGGNAARANRPKKEGVVLDLSGIENALIGLHAGIAMFTRNEDWLLSDEEGRAAGSAIGNVARHYPAVAGSQKIVDWVMLIQTLGFMYGPRVMSEVSKRKAKRHEPVGNG